MKNKNILPSQAKPSRRQAASQAKTKPKPSQAKPSQARKSSLNERKTEEIVREKLRALGYKDQDNGITIEEQKSEIAKVKSLLSKASKNNKGNAGYPELIISNLKDTNF